VKAWITARPRSRPWSVSGRSPETVATGCPYDSASQG
jgi:hypothetical protein